jgi:prolyl oligopeptidase
MTFLRPYLPRLSRLPRPGLLALCLGGVAAAFAQPLAAAPAKTQKKPVTDEFHGVRVTDDYRWLENFADPAVRSWNEEQNRYTRSVLDRSPALPAIRDRLKELIGASSSAYYGMHDRRGVLFSLKFQPPRDQPLLVTLKSPDDPASERVVVDPLKVNPKGTTAIDFYVPSLDGELLAVSLSDRGTEDGTVHVYEVKTGRELPDVVPRVNGGTAGGSLAWNADHTGFYYTRYPRGTERPKEDMGFYQQVYFHKLGTDTKDDTYAIGKDFPRIAEVALQTSEDGKYVLATVGNGDGGEYEHHVLALSGKNAGKWSQLTHFEDHILSGVFGLDDSLYLLSRDGAPRGKLLRLPAGISDLRAAKVVVPESEAVIEHVVPTRSRLYVLDLLGGLSQLRTFGLAGEPSAAVPVLPVSTVTEVVRRSGDEILFNNVTFVEPAAWYRYQPAGKQPGKVVKTALFVVSPVDFGDIEVARHMVASKDGTKVPLTILHKKGIKLDGTNPTQLTGYGGFGISLTPGFSVTRRVWLEQGGVLAIANMRGGGEYGEQWHKAGNLLHKQNVFDDFIACAQHLIDAHITSPQKLAIQGGSNGGLLMGAVVTQRPELFRAVVARVGLYDMLRFSLYPNGAFNVTEYGSPQVQEQWSALYAYSPYHHVKDGTAYPAMLFVSGENDPRVNPADSRKMVARLQAATTSGLPILLRTSSSSGHGSSSLSESILEQADIYTFLFQQLGVNYQPVKGVRQAKL